MKVWIKWIGAAWLGAASWAGAQTPGSQVVVVYNSRLPDSRRVAEHYARQRQVPTEQVFSFDLSTNQDMTRAEFRDELQKPLAKKLEQKKLWHVAPRSIPGASNQPPRFETRVDSSKIRYAVLCYGVPIRILSDPNLKEEGLENTRPELRRNEAAVDSELALLPCGDQELAGPLRNYVYTATNVALLHPTNGVLLVTRLDGPSPEVAMGLVDKALRAEADGLWGRAYFDLRSTTEPGLKTGDEWLRNASEICRHLGWETVVDQAPGTFPAAFPMSQIGIYAGWYDETVSGPLAQPTVEFMPGAFAYHLHSFSGAELRSTNRHWVGPLLARGATATMGCVDEPYLAGTPDIGIFMARWMINGMTFGEAAYAGQPVLSWQTTIVGDPLYRPFGRNPDLVQDDLQRRGSKLVEWSFLRLLNINLVVGRPRSDCVQFLEELGLTKESAVLSEKLGDLYFAQGKPASSADAYEKALKLDPSPLQRVRLRLALGERYAETGENLEALNDYQALLREAPQYPDHLAILRKLLALAQKLNHQGEIARYEAAIKALGP